MMYIFVGFTFFFLGLILGAFLVVVSYSMKSPRIKKREKLITQYYYSSLTGGKFESNVN